MSLSYIFEFIWNAKIVGWILAGLVVLWAVWFIGLGIVARLIAKEDRNGRKP